MNNQAESIRQLQMALKTSIAENVELREQINYLEQQNQVQLEVEIQRLKKVIEHQSEQILKLKKYKETNNIVDHLNYEQIVNQMNERIVEKNQQLLDEQQQSSKLKTKIQQYEFELSNLKEQLQNKNILNQELQQKNYQIDQLLQRVRSKENGNLAYITEIERLNAQIQYRIFRINDSQRVYLTQREQANTRITLNSQK